MSFTTKLNLNNENFFQESGETLTLSGNTYVGLIKYLNDISAAFDEFSIPNVGYLTGITNTKLNINNFITYTGTTAPNTFVNKSSLNTYTGTTAPNTFVNKSSLNTYTGETNSMLIIPTFSASGNGFDRTITVTFKKKNGSILDVQRVTAFWWTSTSSYGNPEFIVGDNPYTPSITAGYAFNSATLSALNTVYTDSTAKFSVRILTISSDTLQNFYLNVSTQGQVYSYVSTIYQYNI
jgi:hypothetical protein